MNNYSDADIHLAHVMREHSWEPYDRARRSAKRWTRFSIVVGLVTIAALLVGWGLSR